MSGYSEFGGNGSMAVSVSTGCLGFKRIADTNDHVAGAGSHTDVTEFVRLQAITATVFGANNVSAEGDNIVSTDPLAAGDDIWGRFTTIDLTSGIVYAYYYK
jgi:hypothetical protein